MDVLLALLLLCLVSILSAPPLASNELQGDLAAYLELSFRNPEVLETVYTRQSKFNLLAVDQGTRDVYIGAVNRTYRLDSDFNQLQGIITHGYGDRSFSDRRDSYYTKLLIIDSARGLIICGSARGICELRNLDDIAEVLISSRSGVVSERNSSPVGIITSEERYLIVGESPDRYNAPLISRRYLEGSTFLEYNYYENAIKLSHYASYDFSVSYVTIYSWDSFTYFVTFQTVDVNARRSVSKVSRVCNEARDLDAYTEITIQCTGSDGSVYNLVQAAHFGPAGPDLAASLGLQADEQVLYAVFAKNRGASDVPTDHSAMCVYRMTDVLAAFREAVRGCIQEGGAYRAWHLEESRCYLPLVPEIEPDNYLCNTVADGTTQLYQYAKGITPVASTALLQLPGYRMSSIVTAIELNHTVAFIGTSSGDLLKVHLEDNVTGRIYERVAVDSSPVLRDIKLDNQTDQLYLLTEQKLLKLRVENCSQYTTCDDCIGTAAGQDGDPYCGWCSLERKCTRYSACHLPDLSTRWLAYDAEQCLEIIDVENSLPLSMTEKKISLIVQQLPDLRPGQYYECRFGSYVSIAVKTGNILACTTPPVDGIPSVKQDDDATTVQLSIYSTETAINFVDVPFHFYECSSHTSCVSCVGSNWTCDWCVFEKRCTHDNSSCMRADEVVITGDNNPRMSSTKGPGFCPQLQAQEGEVLIPVGVKSSITFQTANLPNPAQIFSYACRLRVEGGDMVANARRLNDTVTCEERTYSYTGEEREVDTFLVLEWVDLSNQRHVVNDVHGYIVTLYDCFIIGPDCSRCVTANSELYCLWCGSTCTFDAQCGLSAEITLPHNGHNCPDPVLTGVNPRSGPIEGNTVIAVFGTDLGRRFEDIDTVMVGNQPCDVAGFASLYSTGGSISCLTPPGSEGPALVTLSITGANGTLQSSMGTLTFAYTDPQISNFVPIVGPEAGGTVVTISGFNLQTGNTIEAYFGNSQCVIVSVQDDSLQCRTSPSTAGNADVLRLSFDGAHRTSTSRFSFVSNPQITKVSPLASIQAGGRNLSVTGKDFNIIQTLKIVVYCPANNSLLQFEEQCRRNSDTSLTCPSPDIRPYRCNAGTFGFIMDSVTELLTWSERNDVTLEYFPDPVYFPFDGEGYDVMAIGYLMKIHGKGIDSAVTAKEIVVTVGSERCEVIVIGDNILVCKLPKIQPTSLDGSYYPAAVVHHGNLIFNLGKVIYGHRADHLIAILVPSVIIPLSMAILLAAGLMYCRQMRRKRNFEQQLMERLLEFHHEISSANKQILDGSEGRTCTLPTSKQKRIVLNRRISFVPSDVLIDYTRLEFGKTLGQGAFGRVLRAVLHNTEQEDNIVAVKTVQDTSDSKLVMKFLEEGLIMKRFDHVNVMGLLGLTFDPDDNPMLVLPFMANGDLKTFMIRKKKPLPTSLLLRFASHVALGMAYLAQHKFVHRDLAARNCMVNGDLLVKIADFGLSRDLKELDYYTSDDALAKLPIKWMAPECMERKVYNARTDVWSYGVVLWEIFSQGVSPYPGLANRDVYDFLKTGQRMYAPVNCPPTIYGIMQRCWLDNPKSRCTFTQIVSEVEGLLAGNLDNLPESKAVGSVRKGRAERRGRPDPRRESYLVPMQMETAFGADGPYSDDENNVTGRGGGRDYMNKSVFR